MEKHVKYKWKLLITGRRKEPSQAVWEKNKYSKNNLEKQLKYKWKLLITGRSKEQSQAV